MDWQSLRADFPALDNHTYLNTAGIGITPLPVTREIQRLFGEWSAHGATTPTFRQQVQAVDTNARAQAARLFGADVEELAFTGRVAESLHIVTDGLVWKAGDEIITGDEEVLYAPLYRLVRDYGVVLKKMRCAYDKDEFLNRFSDLLAPRTRLVWLSDTSNKSGFHLPARETCALAHAKGALVMYDGAQTAGQFPLSLREMGCDFYAVTGYKWLLGPYGCGLLYVRKEVIPQVRALRLGRGTLDHLNDSFQEHESAARYEFGVRNVILRAGFGKALEYMATLEPAEVCARIMALRDYLWRELDGIPGATVVSPRDASLNSAITCLVLKGVEPVRLVESAWQANIVIVSTESALGRPDLRGVRISPSFYNSTEDLDRLLEVIRALASRKS